MIDFLCIGAQKAGTTWLMSNLECHPEVWTPRFVKELHFFDALHLGFSQPWLLKKYAKKGHRIYQKKPAGRKYFAKVVDPDFAFSDDWYRHIFSIAPNDAKSGECTPLYAALPEAGIQHVMRIAPKVRLIHIIRNPADRLKSSLRMALERRSTTDTAILTPLMDDPAFLQRGNYAGNIPRWEMIVPKEQILYIPFGDIREAPNAVMRSVEKHLGMRPYQEYPSLTQTVHVTKKKGIDLGDHLMQRIYSICRDQDAFLEDRFGGDFFARCT